MIHLSSFLVGSSSSPLSAPISILRDNMPVAVQYTSLCRQTTAVSIFQTNTSPMTVVRKEHLRQHYGHISDSDTLRTYAGFYSMSLTFSFEASAVVNITFDASSTLALYLKQQTAVACSHDR